MPHHRSPPHDLNTLHWNHLLPVVYASTFVVLHLSSSNDFTGEVTAASGLVFICHAVLVYYSPPGKGLGSLITCFVAGPWFFWCLMAFLW